MTVSTHHRLNRPLRYETFPHRCELGELEFEITEFSVNDDDAVQPDDPRELELNEYEGWSEAELTLTVDIPDELLSEVFPEAAEREGDGSIESCPGNVVVAGHCVETYTRGGEILNDGGEVGHGPVSNTFTLSEENVAGVLELRPYLVRSRPLTTADADRLGLSETHDYATDVGAILSDGPKCIVEIEEDKPGSDDVLLVERISFEEENESDDSPFPPADRMYYLDLKRDPDQPVLYFNEDHEQIVDIVWNGDGRYDELTADLVWDHVMSSVWTRMVQIAAEEFDPESRTWTPEWQPAVFEMLNEHLYTEEDTSPDKAAEFLKRELQEDRLSATERIEQAVQGLLDPGQQFDNHVSRIGKR